MNRAVDKRKLLLYALAGAGGGLLSCALATFVVPMVAARGRSLGYTNLKLQPSAESSLAPLYNDRDSMPYPADEQAFEQFVESRMDADMASARERRPGAKLTAEDKARLRKAQEAHEAFRVQLLDEARRNPGAFGGMGPDDLKKPIRNL